MSSMHAAHDHLDPEGALVAVTEPVVHHMQPRAYASGSTSATVLPAPAPARTQAVPLT
jgi:hypothetical protein